MPVPDQVDIAIDLLYGVLVVPREISRDAYEARVEPVDF